MPKKYKPLAIHLHGDHAETQFYVVEEHVTIAEVLQADMEGIACLCFNQEMADLIAGVLTEVEAQIAARETSGDA